MATVQRFGGGKLGGAAVKRLNLKNFTGVV
jgi:hypothetical protein